MRAPIGWAFLNTSLRPGRKTQSLSWFLWAGRQALQGRDPHPLACASAHEVQLRQQTETHAQGFPDLSWPTLSGGEN